jgi:hypothetical protein
VVVKNDSQPAGSSPLSLCKKDREDIYDLTVEALNSFLKIAQEMYSQMHVSVNGQSILKPWKVSKFSKLFRAAACFFQDEVVRDALTSCLAEEGRFLGINLSAGRDGIVEYFLALPEKNGKILL